MRAPERTDQTDRERGPVADESPLSLWLHRLRFAIPVLLFLALAGWAVATPVGSTPDEDFHLASIWCGLGDRAGLCEPGPNANEREVPEALIQAPCFRNVATKTATCQNLGDTALTATKRVNATGEYPPIYYAVTGILASRSVAASVLAIRLFNAALFTALATALFAMLPRHRRSALTLTWVGALVPLGIFLVPSVNPSSWAITGSVSAWFAALGFFESSRRGPRIAFAVLAALSCVMAAGARADAAVYSVLGIIAAWFITHRTGSRRRRWTLFLLPAAAVVVAVVVVLFAGQTAIVIGRPGAGGVASLLDVDRLFHNLYTVPELWLGSLGSGAFGALGWFDIRLTYLTQLGAIVAFFGVLVLGLRDTSARRLIVIGGWVLVMIVVPLWVLQVRHEIVGQFVQPRYVYPAMLLLLGTAAAMRPSQLRFSAAQLWAIGGASVTAASLALFSALSRFTFANPNRESIDLSTNVAWWWQGAAAGPMVVWIAGTVVFAAAVALALAAVFRTSRVLEPAGETQSEH